MLFRGVTARRLGEHTERRRWAASCQLWLRGLVSVRPAQRSKDVPIAKRLFVVVAGAQKVRHRAFLLFNQRSNSTIALPAALPTTLFS
jgi:hypothetical protein